MALSEPVHRPTQQPASSDQYLHAGQTGPPAVPANMWTLNPEDLPPLLLRLEDVSRVLMIGRAKVYTLIRPQELRSIKVGGSRRVSAMALREYVERLEDGELL